MRVKILLDEFWILPLFTKNPPSGELQVALKLSSSGNSKVRYTGKAQIIKDKNLIGEYKIKNHVIGSNNTLSISENIPLNDIKENGDYILRLIIQYTDEKGRLKSLTRESQFTIDDLSVTHI